MAIKRTILLSSLQDALKQEEGASAIYLRRLSEMVAANVDADVMEPVRERIMKLVSMNGVHGKTVCSMLARLEAETKDVI